MDQQSFDSSTDLDARLSELRQVIREHYLADEASNVRRLIEEAHMDERMSLRISQRAADLIRTIRTTTKPSMMENFLAEYGLSTREGVALMCLSEALLRVPDAETIDALINDKITPSEWGQHLGQSTSSLINASTWGLMLTGSILKEKEEEGLAASMRSMVKRLGEPVIRTAVGQAMKELGRQFVLGTTIEKAIERGKHYEAKGFTYSYDMLGEAARTEADGIKYHLAYSKAIATLAPFCKSPSVHKNPGLSVKLSALHPRYEEGKKARVMSELVSRTFGLALLARSANMNFTIDAEEMDRLDLSLDVIEAVLSNPALEGWDGFGVVVQAFGHRASFVIDWLYMLSRKLDRKITIRLVKGAYWDSEIKRAQVMGLEGFPVFTRKVNSDVSYLSNARRLFDMTDHIYPQFASHNAHTATAVMEMAVSARVGKGSYELQRLHGMGDALHDTLVKQEKVACRIYAPVGAHSDLLAYLVRRLLENGSNSSFVNQIVDTDISPEEIAGDPFAKVRELGDSIENPFLTKPKDIFKGTRRNSTGWDHTDPLTIAAIDVERNKFKSHIWDVTPLIADYKSKEASAPVYNPADRDEQIGTLVKAAPADVEKALAASEKGFAEWSAKPATERSAILLKIGELYEANAPELFAIAAREAGKVMTDAIGEVREAVDFAYYYAAEAERIENEAKNGRMARGTIACISPWNFPLAIFSGQIFAALAAGNAVIAKPAGPTGIMAFRAVQLMHEAGVPKGAIQLLPGSGSVVGTPITSDPRIAGVCFTGSTDTAQTINRAMAETLDPSAPLIAETGGLNAMIVDSTALPEQAVKDVVSSAFQSAGQRCSALRMLYVQEDIYDHVMKMLQGAIDQLSLGNPWDWSTDIGPVIDEAAKAGIDNHCDKMRGKGRLIKQLTTPKKGVFCAPTIIELSGIEELEEEIFGPVLHVAKFKAGKLNDVIAAINAKDFGLTFGLHTRMDNRVQEVIDQIKVGNAYINRNQIGAVVASQPFGGEGLSGTGPKAGGPNYVERFYLPNKHEEPAVPEGDAAPVTEVQYAIHQIRADKTKRKTWAGKEFRFAALKSAYNLPVSFDSFLRRDMSPREMSGPTGESNRLTFAPRGVVLVAGATEQMALLQTVAALVAGNGVVLVGPGAKVMAGKLSESGAPVIGLEGILDPEAMGKLEGVDAIAYMADNDTLRKVRKGLAKRDGALLPLITEANPFRFSLERHVCVDTTAAGGNATLLAAAEGEAK
ncbi:bifunctional proline dehydrogenase/L-glutamate gamma-semialdehyde dehydrogenase PutA [uncultured Cohaesibacter sp.]|uniref:bifunctional proline dehydrogenase/L-glutamate gamma-semialdehyde dehydrogenase PutA n=1 Tax=uncultured Cohaesibacter sp. TaxID=1002546 RepID=UPI0029C931C0|nr:bifunctional proline dehydrogenase/L-glutamate gamma-semialdehyde dehydrogenase PutA [uncultured Cohaesibacter sp.]